MPDLSELQAAIEAHAAATAATITKQAGEIDALKADLLELEQKSVAGITTMPGGGGVDGASALAGELLKNDLVQGVAAKSNRAGGAIQVKTSDLLGLEHKNTVTQNSDPLGPRGYAGIFAGLERRRFIFDLVHKIPVTTGTVDTVRELLYENNAATQAAGSPLAFTEGAAKSESNLTFEAVSLRLGTTAHFLKASTQALADSEQLRGLLERRLRYGLLIRNDAAIVETIVANGGHTAFTPTSGDDAIASVNRAIAAAEVLESQPTVILMSPVSWRQIQRIRAVAGDGQHIVGNPQQITGEMLWGVPVMPTNAVDVGKFIVADFMTAGEYFLRQESVIDFGFVNDDFTKNLVTIRAENRGAYQVIRAVAIQYGDLTL
jgi:HK97 family phage major capsid protein